MKGYKNKLADYIYDAWGNQTSASFSWWADENPVRYAGEYYDTESGLTYLRARYYDSGMGRFISEDQHWNVDNMICGDDNAVSIANILQSSNLYSYCLNNPVNGTDPSGMRTMQEATQIIYRNAQYIKDAAAEFGVNPAILAATIYAEQVLNVDWVDDTTDFALNIFDTSIGVSQVRVSTAKMLEDSGYMEYTTSVVVNGQEQISRGEAIAMKLTDDKTNILYAAAYLKYYQDRWEEAYPEIDGRTAILATLYNQGEIYLPHANPKPNDFGNFAKDNYYYMRELLDCN